MPLDQLCARLPHSVQILQGFYILSSVVSSVALLEEVLDQVGLIVLWEPEHLSTQKQRVQISRHGVAELVQQIELLQDSPQNRAVKTLTVVTHQEWFIEGL